jgi:hypothetical protein
MPRPFGLQIPIVVQEAKGALAGGLCVVIGLQATGEAAAQVQSYRINMHLCWLSDAVSLMLGYAGWSGTV